MTIRKGQIYKQNNMELFVIITGKKGGKWRAKILTEKPGVYRGQHTLSENVLKYRFSLHENI